MKRLMRYRIWLIVLLVLSVTGAYLFSTLQAGPAPKTRIICILKTTERNGFWNSLTEGIEAAIEEYDADVRITGPDEESDVEQQNEIIRNAVAEKPDVIVLAAIDSNLTMPAALEVKQAGIRLVLIDSGLEDHIEDAMVGTDNNRAGVRAGALIQRLMGKDGKLGIISFVKNSLTAIDREEGLKSAVGENNSNVYDTVYCDSDEQRAFELTTQLLNEHPDITVLAGLDQYSSAGAARAVAQLGLSGRVKVVGFDNSKEQIKYLEEGIYEGLVIQKAFNMGYLGIEAAVELVQGGHVPVNRDSGSVLVTKDNMYIGIYQKLLFPFQEE